MSKHRTTDLDLARDELFSHIHRCGVMKAEEEQQEVWMTDTMDYLSERFPDLSREDLGELKTMGMRFCKPAIPHGKQHTALTDPAEEAPASQDEAQAAEEQDEMAGVA